MAHLHRLALAAFLALFACAANAVLPPSQSWSVSYGDRTARGSSAAAACNGLVGATYTGTTGTNTIDSAIYRAPTCDYTYTSTWGPGYSGGGSVVPERGPDVCAPNSLMVEGIGCHCHAGYQERDGQCRPVNPCPEGQHEQGGACVPDNCKPNETRVNGICVPEPPCPAGEVRVNGKCKKADCPAAGTLAGEYMVSGTTPTAMCEGGCTVSITSFLTAYKDGKAASTVGIGYYTGGTCVAPPANPNPDGGGGGGDGGGTGGTGGDGGTGGNGGTGGTGGTGGGTGGGGGGGDNNNPPPPQKCPNGDCTGTDGTGPNDGTDPNSEGDCPPGTYKSGGKCYPNSPPEQPPDNDGRCPPGYAKVGDTCVPYKPDEDDEDDKPSAFGGSCGSFTCDGDAIQCAIAREQHIRACKLFDDESAESKLYNDNKGKEGKQTNDLPGNETVNLFGRISMTDLFGAGAQCTNDVTVVVMGQSITLPFTKICPAIAVIGNIMVAVSLLLAARILTRG